MKRDRNDEPQGPALGLDNETDDDDEDDDEDDDSLDSKIKAEKEQEVRSQNMGKEVISDTMHYLVICEDDEFHSSTPMREQYKVVSSHSTRASAEKATRELKVEIMEKFISNNFESYTKSGKLSFAGDLCIVPPHNRDNFKHILKEELASNEEFSYYPELSKIRDFCDEYTVWSPSQGAGFEYRIKASVKTSDFLLEEAITHIFKIPSGNENWRVNVRIQSVPHFQNY